MKSIRPNTKEAVRLFNEGANVLSRMEANGIRVDVPYLEKAIEETKAHVREQEDKLKSTRIFRKWQQRFGQKTNLFNSGPQLAKVFFDILGNEVRYYTKKTEKLPAKFRTPSTKE